MIFATQNACERSPRSSKGTANGCSTAFFAAVSIASPWKTLLGASLIMKDNDDLLVMPDLQRAERVPPTDRRPVILGDRSAKLQGRVVDQGL